MKVAVVASTQGSVYRETCRRNPFVRSVIGQVVSDRPCGALVAAAEFGHARVLIDERNGEVFSSRLCEHLQATNVDVVVSFFTRLFRAPVVDAFAGRLVNFHPSILPACPGMDGFGDTLRSGALFVGSTVHFVDSGVDTGLPLLQACIPRDPSLSETELRHRVFVQQCRSLVQVLRWFDEQRVRPQWPPVAHASYVPAEFAPNLDSRDAIELVL